MTQTQTLMTLSETEFVSRTNILVIKCILWTGTVVRNPRRNIPVRALYAVGNIRGVAYLLSMALLAITRYGLTTIATI